MERKTVIKLSGSMAQRFGRTHRRALTSASEVFRALSNTIDGFDAYLRETRAKGLDFVIFRNQINIGKEFDLLGPGDELRIIPVIRGSKRAGLFQIVTAAAIAALPGGTQWDGQQVHKWRYMPQLVLWLLVV
jgi:predicted phage tail protein